MTECVPERSVCRNPGIKTQHIGSIWGMYVPQAVRGTGLSRLLLRAAVDEVGTMLRSLRISVVSSNVPAFTNPEALKNGPSRSKL